MAPLRCASILGLAFVCIACTAEEKPTTEEFEATVVFVKMRSEYSGNCYVIDSDVRWVVRLRKKDGSETTYAIHSPAHALIDDYKTVAGKSFLFRETTLKLLSGHTKHELERVLSKDP